MSSHSPGKFLEQRSDLISGRHPSRPGHWACLLPGSSVGPSRGRCCGRATWKRAASPLTSGTGRCQSRTPESRPASRLFPPARPVPGTRAQSPQGPGAPARRGGGGTRESQQPHSTKKHSAWLLISRVHHQKLTMYDKCLCRLFKLSKMTGLLIIIFYIIQGQQIRFTCVIIFQIS